MAGEVPMTEIVTVAAVMDAAGQMDEEAWGGADSVSGVTSSRPRQESWRAGVVEYDVAGQPKAQFGQLLDLIGASITVTQNNQAVTYRSPFQSDPSKWRSIYLF